MPIDLPSINLTQEFVFETDELKSLKEVTLLICNIIFGDAKSTDTNLMHYTIGKEIYQEDTEYENISQGKTEKKEARMYVGSLNCYRGDFNRSVYGDMPKDVAFESFEDAVEKVVQELEAANKKRFKKKCGTGTHFAFLSSDGDVGIGYRVAMDRAFPSGLDFSLCHIYYGK